MRPQVNFKLSSNTSVSIETKFAGEGHLHSLTIVSSNHSNWMAAVTKERQNQKKSFSLEPLISAKN